MSRFLRFTFLSIGFLTTGCAGNSLTQIPTGVSPGFSQGPSAQSNRVRYPRIIQAPGASYEVQVLSFPIETLGCPYGSPTAASDKGRSFVAESACGVPGSFSYVTSSPPSTGVFHPFHDCGLLAINDVGRAVGYNLVPFAPPQPVVTNNGACKTLPILTGDKQGQASGINDHGTIAGNSIGTELPCVVQVNCPSRAVEWVNGQIVRLSAVASDALGINTNGLVLGDITKPQSSNVVIWTSPNHYKTVSNNGQAGQLNDLGHATFSGAGGAFFYNGASSTLIQSIPGDGPLSPQGIDNADNVFGFSFSPAGDFHTVRWSRGSAARLQSFIPPSVHLVEAGTLGVSADGVVMANATVGNDTSLRAVLLIPEASCTPQGAKRRPNEART